MSRVNNQLLKIMSILDEQAKLNPKDADIQLRLELLADCPDHAPLLNKLEQEYKVINILQRPDERDFGEPDHGMFEMEQPKNYDRYMSYFISLNPTFDKYVQELYKDPKYRELAGIADEPTSKTESVSVNHARKNGVMTGKEKIQAVVEDINNAYQGLVAGNVVVLHSGNLEQRGLQMHEQKQVLDILAKDKKVIKYTAKNEYESRADIHPRDQVDILDGSFDELEANEMFDRVLEQQLYTVEVLSAFAALANELLGDAELEYNKDIFLLRLFYNRVIGILDAVVSADIVIEDDKLDFAYVKLTSLVENVLSKPSMKDWQKDAPELYETLLGHAEDIGEGWQYTRVIVLKYYAKLQKDWMLNSSTEFTLDDNLTAMFEKIDGLIAIHRKAAREAADSWKKRVDAIAKDYRAGKIDLNGKVIIDKQEKPKVEKYDDTIPEPDEKPEPAKEPAAPTTAKVDIHPLQPSHYHDKTGKLNVSAGVDVFIAVRGKVTRKNRTKYDQCHLMSCLFKTVNTLNNGVTFSKFLGVKYDKNTKTHIRKIRNTVNEINKKVADKTTAKKLILVHNEKIFADKSYLKK